MNINSVSAASPAPVSGKQQQELKKACQEFEAIFLNNLLKSMRQTVSKSDLFGSSQQEDMFRDMMDSEISKSAAKTNSMGIADMIYRQMSGESRFSSVLKTDETEGASR